MADKADAGQPSSATATAVQGLVWSGMAAEAPWIFLQQHFSLRVALHESSKVETT